MLDQRAAQTKMRLKRDVDSKLLVLEQNNTAAIESGGLRLYCIAARI